MDNRTDLHKLAVEVLRMMDAQREYFKRRQPSLLSYSKQLEARLRHRCAEILEAEQGEQLVLIEMEEERHG